MSIKIATRVMAVGILVLAEIFRRRLRSKNTRNDISASEDLVTLEQPPHHVGSLQPNEVFISFRGEDVRNNFVSHLLSALKDRGIRTYLDEDNLEKGQTIGPELLKAIEESSIAIVVLSSNYGQSSWCLDELVKIMECKIESGLIVFPIFYDVDPSDVRKHKVNLKNNSEKVEDWKKALTKVAGISGYEISGK